MDLSLRLRISGWTLKFDPSLIAFHCRGWDQKRTNMPKKIRLFSARNEIRVNQRAGNPIGVFYSLMKFMAVKLFNC